MICKNCKKTTGGKCYLHRDEDVLFNVNNSNYPRGFVRDYLRRCGLNFGKIDKICKQIPQGFIGKDFNPRVDN